MNNNLPEYLQAIAAKFPLEIDVTNEMISEGRKQIKHANHCIGARMLESLLPEGYKREEYVCWGVQHGHIGDVHTVKGVVLNVKSDVNIEEIRSKQTIKLILE